MCLLSALLFSILLPASQVLIIRATSTCPLSDQYTCHLYVGTHVCACLCVCPVPLSPTPPHQMMRTTASGMPTTKSFSCGGGSPSRTQSLYGRGSHHQIWALCLLWPVAPRSVAPLQPTIVFLPRLSYAQRRLSSPLQHEVPFPCMLSLKWVGVLEQVFHVGAACRCVVSPMPLSRSFLIHRIAAVLRCCVQQCGGHIHRVTVSVASWCLSPQLLVLFTSMTTWQILAYKEHGSIICCYTIPLSTMPCPSVCSRVVALNNESLQ